MAASSLSFTTRVVAPSVGRSSLRARRSVAPTARGSVVVKAQYPNPEYIAQTISEFPAKGVATAEEGRCLWDDGYNVLDVRALEEIDSNDNTPCPNPPEPGKCAVRALPSQKKNKKKQETHTPFSFIFISCILPPSPV